MRRAIVVSHLARVAVRAAELCSIARARVSSWRMADNGGKIAAPARSGRARRLRRRAWLLLVTVPVAALATVLTLTAATPAVAACGAEVDGRMIGPDTPNSRSNPIEIAGDTISLQGEAGEVWGFVWIGPVPVPFGYPDADGVATIDVDSWFGGGLVRVDVNGAGAGDCEGTYWFRVDAGFPLASVAGGAGAVLLLGGTALAISAVRRGRGGRCSPVRGAFGGFVGGAGAMMLLHLLRIDAVPTTGPWTGLLTLVPAGFATFAARRACIESAALPVLVDVVPVLEAPTSVVAGGTFDVQFGFAVAPLGRRRRRRTRGHELTAELVVGGAVDGAGRRFAVSGRGRRTHLTRSAPVTIDVPGTANVTVFYAHGGETVGMARRQVDVVVGGGVGDGSGGGAPWPAPTSPGPPDPGSGSVGAPFRVPTTVSAADLELRAVHRGPRALNVLEWTAESPHRERLPMPTRPVVSDLGGDPDAFAAGLVRSVAAGDGRPGLQQLLVGAGRRLSQVLGPELVGLVRAVLSLDLGRPARILLLTEEASVPWELLTLEPVGPGESMFLATRAAVGRWYLVPQADVLPPPVNLEVADRAVIATDDLPAARHEAGQLVAALGFRPAPPTVEATMAALQEHGVVHLACHGSWSAGDGIATLALSDGELTSLHVGGLDLSAHPLVFLNACHVASGTDVLGVPAGFPAALVATGAGAAVVPLWAVRDDHALAAALEFHREVLAGVPPAEVVRRLRSRAVEGGLAWATPFAYQFVGHPGAMVTVSDPAPRQHSGER